MRDIETKPFVIYKQNLIYAQINEEADIFALRNFGGNPESTIYNIEDLFHIDEFKKFNSLKELYESKESERISSELGLIFTGPIPLKYQYQLIEDKRFKSYSDAERFIKSQDGTFFIRKEISPKTYLLAYFKVESHSEMKFITLYEKEKLESSNQVVKIDENLILLKDDMKFKHVSSEVKDYLHDSDDYSENGFIEEFIKKSIRAN